MLVDTRVEKARKLVFSANGKFYSIKITYLSYKKGKPKNFRTDYTDLFWQKLLSFQRTFLEKSFVSGFGAEAPTYLSYKKGKPKNFMPTALIYFGKSF